MPDIIRAVKMSPLNPMRFIPLYDAKPGPNIYESRTVYNTWKFDHGLYVNQRRPDQTEKPYEQKWYGWDDIAVYMDTLADTVIGRLLDANGKDIDVGAGYATTFATVPGNTYNVPGTEDYYPYNSMYFHFEPNGADYFPDGIYQIRLEFQYPDGSDYMISEPLNIRHNDQWNRTLLIEYNNDKNGDVMFEQLRQYGEEMGGLPLSGYPFMLRVEGQLDDPEPASKDTVFTDSGHELNNLQSIPYRRRQLIIGGGRGIPAYLLDKVNRILSLTDVKIDGTKVIKDDSTLQITATKNEYNQLYMGTIYLREKEEDLNWVYPFKSAVELVALQLDESNNVRYPYALNFLGVNNGFVSIITSAVIIEDSAAQDAYINYLNTVFMPTTYGTGHFSVGTNNVIYYTNGQDENYHAFPGMVCFADSINLLLDANFSTSFDGSIVATDIAAMTITDYGDGSMPIVNQLSSYSISHVYAAAGEYTVRIFNSGAQVSAYMEIGQIRFNSSTGARIEAILPNSVAPYSLYSLTMHYSFGYGIDIDFGMLNYCFAALKQIIVTAPSGSLPLVFSNNVFDLADPANKFGQLETIVIAGNLTTAAVNAVILSFAYNAIPITSGSFIITGDPTPAPPDGGALAFIDSLGVTPYSWGVIHD